MINMDTLEIKVFQETVKTLMKKIRSQELVQIDSDERVEDKINSLSIREKQGIIETIFWNIPLPEVYIDISDRGCWRLIKGNYLFLLSDFMVAENFPVYSTHFSKMFPVHRQFLEDKVVNIVGLNIPDPDNFELISRKMLSLHF